jgi:hypothetical protein
VRPQVAFVVFGTLLVQIKWTQQIKKLRFLNIKTGNNINKVITVPTFQERIGKDGKKSFRAIVRRKGQPVQTRTFDTVKEANLYHYSLLSEVFRMVFYSETITLRAIEEITEILSNAPMTMDYEIQDQGDFLLININFSERPSQLNLETWRKNLKEHFSKIFPKPEKDYSWMINIMHNRYILESVMDEIT